MATTDTARASYVRPFVVDDYPACAREIPTFVGDAVKVGREVYDAGPAFTLVGPDATVLACAGVIIPWPGMGMAWAMVTPEARQHPAALHRAVSRGLRAIIREHRLRRVQAEVVAEFWVARRWLQVLGFEEEGRMKRYGPHGEDFLRVVMFPGGTR